jgi:hypothetical protein
MKFAELMAQRGINLITNMLKSDRLHTNTGQSAAAGKMSLSFLSLIVPS